MAINKYKFAGSVYIHSAPVYLTLLIGKATGTSVKVILDYETTDIDTLKLGFVMNSMLNKLVVSTPTNKACRISDAGLVITTNPSLPDQMNNKKVLLWVSSSANKPRRSILKLTSSPVCS